jgi:poly-gamma-glutamate capsule biosynthesis protein CapA/YwtB (metallophosphatase superfamily)
MAALVGRRLLLAPVLLLAILAGTVAIVPRPAGTPGADLGAPGATLSNGTQTPTAADPARPATDPTGAIAESTPALQPVPARDGPAAGRPSPGDGPSVRLMVVGDVMLARSIGAAVKQHGAGVVFEGLMGRLSAADLLAVNLECTIATIGRPARKHFTFRAPPLSADALRKVGVDVAGQANNHALDFGPKALAQTRAILARRGIAVVGAGHDRAAAHAPAILERSGLRIAFLAYVTAFTESTGFNTASWASGTHRAGVAIARPRVIRADVHLALRRADLVVVLIHAGVEGSATPTSQQRRLATAAIGAGATLVVGAHPHVLQGYALHAGRLVAYGMGNFVFDKTRGIGADSAVLDVTLTRDGIAGLHWIPVRLRGGLPTLARAEDARRIRAALRPIPA